VAILQIADCRVQIADWIADWIADGFAERIAEVNRQSAI
jgi:hypothetical protein